MSMVTGLLALAVCGGEPIPASPVVEPGHEITCSVEMMTVDGLDWRSTAYPKLKPASRQGSATIWTADRSLKATLEASTNGKFVRSPGVTTTNDANASINSDKTIEYVRHVDRISDGPINEGTVLGFQPETATIRTGFHVDYSGRRLDQGVLAKVKLAESHVGTLHQVILPEQTKPVASPIAPSATPTGVGRQILQSILSPKQTKWAFTIEVPEVFLSQVEGEWFVPNDGILLVSLGVNTVADADGKAVVQERLAILDFARPCDEACVVPTATTPACQVEMVQVGNLTMPRVPDRSIPEAVDQDGQVFELPPLPEAYASNDLNQINPGSPLASPQSPATSKMIADPQLARTSLEVIPDSELEDANSLLQTYYSRLAAAAKCDAELANTGSAVGLTKLDTRFCPVESDGLASIVEQFLRKGMTPSANPHCDEPGCPAEGCPFSAEGCDEPKPATAAKVEMGISVRDGKGLCVFDSESDIVAALKNPGKTEVKYIPLGGNLALEIQAKVVPNPSAMAKAKQATAPTQR